jgi:hypothetical protein
MLSDLGEAGGPVAAADAPARAYGSVTGAKWS